MASALNEHYGRGVATTFIVERNIVGRFVSDCGSVVGGCIRPAAAAAQLALVAG
ncbi:MAG: hypothetical protein JWN95_939 [Frankiales bacterium]|nr:hypothetical protein [Frankiales bacterium]